jgi:hypothetical protein
MNWIKALNILMFIGLLSGMLTHALATANAGLTGKSPQFSYLMSDGIKLARQTSQPAACTPDYDGKITMNADAQLCVCDGRAKQWKNVGTGESCVW